MQKIEAVIASKSMDAVTDALAAVGTGAMTLATVTGRPGAGRALSYRGVAHRVPDACVKIELVVGDREAATLANVIREACAADPRARIWVSGVAEPATIAAAPRYDIAV